MEKYCEDKGICRGDEPVQAGKTMTEHMKRASAAADDVLRCVGRIRDHLFGAEPAENCEKLNDPRCFNDDVVRTSQTIHKALNELYKICALLGVE